MVVVNVDPEEQCLRAPHRMIVQHMDADEYGSANGSSFGEDDYSPCQRFLDSG